MIKLCEQINEGLQEWTGKADYHAAARAVDIGYAANKFLAGRQFQQPRISKH